MWRDYSIIFPCSAGKDKFEEVFSGAQEFWARGNGEPKKVALQIARSIGILIGNLFGFAYEDGRYYVLFSADERAVLMAFSEEGTQEDVEDDAAGRSGCTGYYLGDFKGFGELRKLPKMLQELCNQLDKKTEIWVHWGTFDHIN